MYTPPFTITDEILTLVAEISNMLQCIKQAIDDVKTPKETSKKTPKEIILSLIESNPKVTVQEMAETMGMNKRNAQKHVNTLVEEGLVQRIGAARGGHWEIIK